MIRRLRLKFVLINMLIVTIIIGAISGLILSVTSMQLEGETRSTMETLAREPYRLGLPNSANDDGIRLPYFVVDINQYGIITATGGGYYDLSDTDYLTEIINEVAETDEKYGELSDYGLRYLRSATINGERIVFTDTSYEHSALRNLGKLLLTITAATLALFLGISVLLSYWAVKPVDKAWKQQKQFVADASHELKTPLTVIMTNAEMLQDPECSPALQGQLSNNILVMSNQMRSLVESLLELARMDNGSTKIVLEDFDLSAAVTDAELPFEPMFFEKGLTLECNIEPGIRMHGSVSHLKQLTEILLDNAQKYCSTNAKTTLTLKRQGKHCVLTVADEGEPIAKADLENIFKRFYRVDEVRTISHSYGLGLSIAQSIAETHHGKIHAESSGGINSFIVTLPVL